MFHSFHTGLAEIQQYEPRVRQARAQWTRELVQQARTRLRLRLQRAHRHPATADDRARPETP